MRCVVIGDVRDRMLRVHSLFDVDVVDDEEELSPVRRREAARLFK